MKEPSEGRAAFWVEGREKITGHRVLISSGYGIFSSLGEKRTLPSLQSLRFGEKEKNTSTLSVSQKNQ